jgi:hypothetical protein
VIEQKIKVNKPLNGYYDYYERSILWLPPENDRQAGEERNHLCSSDRYRSMVNRGSGDGKYV